MERINTRLWTWGLRLRNLAKRASILGPIEPALLAIVPHLIRPPKTEVSVSLPFGLSLLLPPRYPVARSYVSGFYEPEVTALFCRLTQPGMTVVDVGANVGYYTMLAGHLVGRQGHIFAFEPDPLNYRYLLRNIEVNDCVMAKPAQLAVRRSGGRAQFVRDPHGAEGHVVVGPHSRSGVLNVVATSLDEFFRGEGWPRVDIVKLDIEGGETDALEGMRELSDRNPQMQVIMELNGTAMERVGASIQRLTRVIRELGFERCYTIEGRRELSIERLPFTSGTYNLLLIKDLEE